MSSPELPKDYLGTLIGIDPGAKGRWVVLDRWKSNSVAEKITHLHTGSFPVLRYNTYSEHDSRELQRMMDQTVKLLKNTERFIYTKVYLEEINLHAQANPTSILGLSRKVGAVMQALGMHFSKIYIIPPATWKPYFGLRGKPKKASIAKVQALLGRKPKTADEADATLIAMAGIDYAKRRGEPLGKPVTLGTYDAYEDN